MNKVLVIGAGGQLGTALQHYCIKNHSKASYIFSDVNRKNLINLDGTDYDSVLEFAKQYGVTHIINCAAYTNVAKAEEDKDLCEKLNVELPRTLSHVANAIDATLIHISSDYVYSCLNKSTPFKESDIKFNEYNSVKGVYGKTKYHGDLAVWNNCKKFFIFRTSWLYYEGFDTAFPMKILKRLNSNNENDYIINVVEDQIGTPTYAGDLAEAIIKIIDDERTTYGIYNYSNLGVCSWYDFAVEVSELSNIFGVIEPCHCNDKIRPYYSVMDKTKFMQTFEQEIPYWKYSLKQYINRCNI